MNSICFFSSYFKGSQIPYYIKVYLIELKRHFNEVVFIYTDSTLSQESKDFLEKIAVKYCFENNEGFDFGQWYKAFQKHDIANYDRVALVNDSCVLFKSLNNFMQWANTNTADLQGITKSSSIHNHIQSYCLVINKKAIPLVKEYFNKHKVLNSIEEVIHTYEIGLSKYLLDNGCSIDAFMENKSEYGEFSPYYYCIEQHIKDGVPVIKKKIIFSSYRKAELFTLARMNFNIDVDYYIRLIKSVNKELLIDFDQLKKEQKNELNHWDVLVYNIKRKSIQFIRLFRKQQK